MHLNIEHTNNKILFSDLSNQKNINLLAATLQTYLIAVVFAFSEVL